MSYPTALLGGALIGLAVTIMLALNGRVTGISGIINQGFTPPFRLSFWRHAFLIGVLCGGVVAYIYNPSFFTNSSGRNILEILIAGFLVGFGSVLANGCTSGHGVCGISRFSLRSLIATLLFIGAGMTMVLLLRWMGWIL